MVLEQFIRQFKLYEKYEKMMMSDGNVYIAKKEMWDYFDERCKDKKYWFATWKGSTLETDFSNVRKEYFDTCGTKSVSEAEKFNLPVLHLPFVAKSLDFLKLLWKANQLRKLSREYYQGAESGMMICHEGNFFINFFFIFF